MPVTKTEPVALGALVTSAVNAVLLVLSAFNVASLSGDQTAAVFGIVNIVIAVVIAIKTRSVVYAPATVQDAANEAALPHV